MIGRSDTVIYIPTDGTHGERWERITASLKAAGFSDIRPAPMPSTTPQARPVMPLLICPREA